VTWRLGVVGHPIEHSLSPVLHETGLALAHLAGSSQRVDVTLERAGSLATMLQDRFDALSVTMPLKFVAGEYCDEVDKVAARIGSVNSLLVRDGRVHGASTDGAGFVDACRLESGLDVEGVNAVVLGAGGAARAIVDALVGGGARHVTVVGRTPAHVSAISDHYPGVTAASTVGGGLDLVVNTVPSSGRADPATVLDGVHDSTLAVDITYEPRVSAWSAAYDQAGCRSVNGLAMLACQASLQMQWWWDVQIDPRTLLEAIT
jgi:shikimate dehydrogenase